MNNHFKSQSPNLKLFLALFSIFILLTGFVFATNAQPALASNPAQAATGTATVAGSPTAAASVTAAATLAPTAAGTATSVATLAAPAVTGTPTVLVPVTGADLTPPGGGQSGLILRIALGLLGLFLIVLGFRSYKLSKK